jgi:hypothetical protein
VSPARNSHRDEDDVEDHAYCSLKRFLDDPRLTIGPAVCIGADTRGGSGIGSSAGSGANLAIRGAKAGPRFCDSAPPLGAAAPRSLQRDTLSKLKVAALLPFR